LEVEGSYVVVKACVPPNCQLLFVMAAENYKKGPLPQRIAELIYEQRLTYTIGFLTLMFLFSSLSTFYIYTWLNLSILRPLTHIQKRVDTIINPCVDK